MKTGTPRVSSAIVGIAFIALRKREARRMPSSIRATVIPAPMGARRADGNTIVERLEALDEDAHRLSCALLTDTPFRNCLTTMSMRDLGPYQAELAWSATFQPDGLPESDAVALLEGAFELSSRALQHFLAASAP